MKFLVDLDYALPLALTLSACAGAQGAKAPAESTPAVSSAAAEGAQPVAPVPSSTQAAPAAPAATNIRLYVGSGDWGTATGAVSVLDYDPSSGALAVKSKVEAGGLLSFLASDSQHRYLYAADEEQKKLRSFSISTQDGSLTPIATVDTIAGAVYINVPRNDRFILAAQFNSGRTEAFQLESNGGFGKRTAEVASGKESHGVFLAPDERFAFVPGRGSDQVQTFAFDTTLGTLQATSAASVPKGAGSRHFDFHPNGKFAYLINEFANTIVVFSYDASSGRLAELQTISTNPDAGVKSSAADVHVHPNGKFLYATNRPVGVNGSIVAFAIGADGKLTFLQKESTQGQVPRNFDLVADGTRIVVGNQESKSILTLALDPATGALTSQALTTLEVKPFFVSDL